LNLFQSSSILFSALRAFSYLTLIKNKKRKEVIYDKFNLAQDINGYESVSFCCCYCDICVFFSLALSLLVIDNHID